MFVPSKNETKKNIISAHGWHFLRTEIDSTNFKNEKFTAKITRKEIEKPCFFKKIFQKILKLTKPLNKIST